MISVESIPAAPKPYEVVNRQMIHDSIIQERKDRASREQEKTDIPTEYSEDVVYEEETELKLSYKNILKIENLIGLHNLKKLCLDNNVIVDISGLDQLKNLTWLDLSFNNIKEIKGLEQLVHLTDLTLFSNKIQKIQNIFHLEELIFLSLGNNDIKELNQVTLLRQLPKLRALTLAGNPLCQDQDYKTVCLAYLKNIRYLDYVLIEEKEIIEAREIKQDELLTMNETELIQDAEREKKKSEGKLMEQLKEAYLDVSITIIPDILTGDQELNRIKILPYLKELIDNLSIGGLQVGEILKTEGMGIYRNMKKEYSMYYKSSTEHKTKVEQKCIDIINQFLKLKKKTLEKISLHSDFETNSELTALISEIERVKNKLLNEEVELMDIMKKFNDKFETRYLAIVATFKEKVSIFFHEIEELVKQFTKELNIKIIDLCELYANEAPEAEQWDDDIKNILMDKENLISGANQIAEGLIGRLLAKDDQLGDKIKLESKSLIEKINTEEIKRNQNRITEISTFVKKETEELNALLNYEEEGGSDDD